MLRGRHAAIGAWAAALAAGALLSGQAPQSGESDLFFIQMTDPQFGMATANRDFAQETANLEFAVATANRLKPRFVIMTGDLVNRSGDAAQIAEYQRIMKKLDPSIHSYTLPGNHDVGNVPAPADLAGYRKSLGADYYSFREGPLYGIALNSVLYHSPQAAPEELRKQQTWLESELEKAKQSGAAHIIVFLHHPLFVENGEEPDQYFNIPLARRRPLLELLAAAGVRWVYSGHYHRNAEARQGSIEAITTGPVGKPLGGARSGMRLVWIKGTGVTHRYAEFGDLPNDGRAGQ